MSKEKSNSSETLQTVLQQIEREFGKGSVVRLGDKPKVDVEALSSGSILLDSCLGIGGYPKGRIIEIYGPESSGKTTLALTAVAEAQSKGGIAAYIDAENSIDPEYAKNLGVNIDDLILSQPDSGEEALEIVESLASSGVFSLIVVDSVAALVPKAELDGAMIDSSVGLQARMMSKAMRKITGVLSKNNCTVIFINQLRDKVGVIYGSNETTTGGRALKFFASVRIDIRRSEAIKDGINIIGNTCNIKVVKNKVAPPFRSCKIDIIYGKGISKEGELLDLGLEYGYVKRSGSWYEIYGERMGQGRETAKQFLAENTDIRDKLKENIVSNFKVENNSEETTELL
ncbi:MAG: recombinase RecA [bacterium]|nr:recombinase RecA [bacterium]MDD7616552.1 recombinase RecA [bacterium]